jgi:hypothetical protein
VIDQAKDNAARMWHSLGFHRRHGTAEQNAQQFDNAVTVNALKEKLLAAERQGSGRRPRRIRNRSRRCRCPAAGARCTRCAARMRCRAGSEPSTTAKSNWSGGSGASSAVVISGSFSRVTPRWSQALDEWVSGKTSPATLGRLPAV